MKLNKKKILFVTGSRAEYSLLRPIMEKIRQNVKFQIQLLVTGMHFLREFGNTSEIIKTDGFKNIQDVVGKEV